ncbi:MAG TPA: hypothetical protein VF516_21550, partial [Kofleriaceae bacterium]
APELAAEFHAVLRAQPREQLRSAAQHWQDRARPRSLLWSRDVLAEVERWTQPASRKLSELECSFVAASQRRARRIRWVRRSLAMLAVAGVFGALQVRSAMQADLAEQRTRLAEQRTRSAQQLAETRVTQAELEQGRAALLHGEPEAQAHLTEAYRRDPSSSTAFMLARAIQPRLMEQARFASTHGRMWSAAFSPDGQQIVTTDDRAAQIWDANTHQLRFTLPHGCEVYDATYSPDGAWLVTAARTAVKRWDARSGRLVRTWNVAPGSGAPSDYYRAAISPDGRLVAAIDAVGSAAQVWNAASGERVAELHNRAAGFPAIAFSSQGWLATTGGEEVRVFDVRTWQPVATLPGPVHSLAFDARTHLVTGAATGEIAIWALPSGARLQDLRRFGESVEAVAFSTDGQRVAAGSRDGATQVWHAASGALQSQLNPRHSKVLAVEFDRTARFLLAAGADGSVVVADAAQGLPVAVLDGPGSVVRVAHFDPSSRSIVGASWDGTARVWDASSPYRRWSSAPISNACAGGMGSEPDRRFIAIGCGDLPIQLWDTAQDQPVAELPSVTRIEGGDFTSAAPAVSAAGDRAAIARNRVVEVYQLPARRLLRAVPHSAPVSSVAYASTGRDLISGAVDGLLLITHDDGTQRSLHAPAGIDAAELLPDGRAVVSDALRHLRIYGPGSTVLADLELPTRVMSLRGDQTRLVAIPSYLSEASPPLLIDLERYRVIAQLAGHVGQVFSARWVAGGRILTAGADGTARMWDGVTGRLLQVYRGGSRFLGDVTLMTDDVVIGGDADGVLRFWDATSGAKLWALQAHKSAIIGVHVEGNGVVTRGFTGEISRWRLPAAEEVIGACGNHPHCAIVAQ